MHALGDPHNFGKSVSKQGYWVHKPRFLGWEWLFLSNASPLRNLPALVPVFDHWMQLAFEPNPSTSFGGGKVQCISPFPQNQSKLSLANWNAVGFTAATISWFGLSDCHHENMVIGRVDNETKFWCFPLDIESALDDFKLVAQTLLIPSSLYPNVVSGFQPLLSSPIPISIQEIAALCSGYLTCFDLLESKESEISILLADYFLEATTPSRVILRATMRYKDWQLHGIEDSALPFCPTELEQLARGDIPYFFRFLNSQTIYVLNEAGVPHKVSIPIELMKKHQDYLPVEFPYKYRFRKTLRQAGVLQMARSFLGPDLCGSAECANLRLEVTPTQITIHDGVQGFASQRTSASASGNRT